MLIDQTNRSKGRYVIMCNVHGSYGEVVRRSVGRLESDIERVAKRVSTLVSNGAQGVCVIDSVTHNLVDFS